MEIRGLQNRDCRGIAIYGSLNIYIGSIAGFCSPRSFDVCYGKSVMQTE
jgi:hypothetical protein